MVEKEKDMGFVGAKIPQQLESEIMRITKLTELVPLPGGKRYSSKTELVIEALEEKVNEIKRIYGELSPAFVALIEGTVSLDALSGALSNGAPVDKAG